MGIFEIDKSKLSKEGTTISIKYTAMEGDTDVKDTQRFNIGLKTGDKWNSPAIKDYYGKTGGEVNLTLTADDMKKIGADDKVYVHVGTGTAGFKGTFTYLSVTAGEDSLVSELPKAVSYVESGLAQWLQQQKLCFRVILILSNIQNARLNLQHPIRLSNSTELLVIK